MNQQAIIEQDQRNDEEYSSESVFDWREVWTEKMLQDPDTVTDGIWVCRYPKSDIYQSAEARKEYDANQLITLRDLFRRCYETNGQDTEAHTMIGQILADNYANYVDIIVERSAGVR